MQTQEKSQYTSMEEFLQIHQDETSNRSEIEKAFDEFDVLLKRHLENSSGISNIKIEIIDTGKHLGLRNESLQMNWGDPDKLEEAIHDPSRIAKLSQGTIKFYSELVDSYYGLIKERKEIENNAKTYIEKVINAAHSENDLRKLFAHINNSGDYRLAEILHNERIKSTIESNLLRLKIENNQSDRLTTEAQPLSPVWDNAASNLTTTQDILQRPVVEGAQADSKSDISETTKNSGGGNREEIDKRGHNYNIYYRC